MEWVGLKVEVEGLGRVGGNSFATEADAVSSIFSFAATDLLLGKKSGFLFL